jgi:hypothetical protein
MASVCATLRRCNIFRACASVAWLLVGAILCPVLFQQAAIAQEAEAESNEEALGPLEEIIVVAPRSLSSMRGEIRRAEENVLALFNAMNDDHDYDIRCRQEAPLGSHIPVRICNPRFVDRLIGRETQLFLRTGVYAEPVGEIRQHQEILNEMMRTMADENSELRDEMLLFYQLKTRYDAERKERLEGKFFAW